MKIDSTNEEEILHDLRISYKLTRFDDTVIFFCTAPDGLTFDLQIDRQTISLWRILAEDWAETANRLTFRWRLVRPFVCGISFEVTTERDLLFSCVVPRQTVSDNDFGSLVAEFCQTLTRLDQCLDQPHGGDNDV